MKTKKKVPFGGQLLIYITVVLTIIFVALAFWWRLLACYEASRPDGVMDKYMTEALPEDVQAAVDGYSTAHETSYQSENELASVLANRLGSDQWTYQKNEELSSEDYLVFDLCRNGEVIGEISMTAVEADALHLGYGGWQLSEATFDFAQFGNAVTVMVPYGCEVYADGALVSEDEVEETVGLYPQLLDYETLISQPNQLLVYHLETLFEEVAVEFSEGYTMVKDEKTGVIYAMPVCSDELAYEMIDFCKRFVQAYVDYTMNYNGLWAVQQYVVPDGALYEELTAFSSGLNWGHGIGAEIMTLDIKNFTYYGNVITCQATYFMTTSEGESNATMDILMEETVLGWRVVHAKVNE